MKLLPKNQRGLTLISILFILISIGASALLLLKVVPVYLDHSKVASALSALKSTDGVEGFSEAEVKSNLKKRFDLNYVYDVTEDDIKVTKRGGYLRVAIEYEVAKKIIGNLSILAEFNDIIEVGQK